MAGGGGAVEGCNAASVLRARQGGAGVSLGHTWICLIKNDEFKEKVKGTSLSYNKNEVTSAETRKIVRDPS